MATGKGQDRAVEHERMGVFNATTIFLSGLRHDPGSVRIMNGAGSFQRLRRMGMQWGLAGENSQGTQLFHEDQAVVLWLKNPLRSSNDSTINFGESPEDAAVLTVAVFLSIV